MSSGNVGIHAKDIPLKVEGSNPINHGKGDSSLEIKMIFTDMHIVLPG